MTLALKRPTAVEWISIIVGVCSLAAYGVTAAGFPFRLRQVEVVSEKHTAQLIVLRDSDAERKSDVRSVRESTERIEKTLDKIQTKLEQPRP